MLNLKALIQDLTLEEKVTLISGFDSWHTHKIERLNIPSIKMSDGPNGVRGNGNSGKSSACFPSPISIGSTWNLDLIDEIGKALGEESKLKDVDVLLGPTINIHRHPLGGRHFESYSEDPYLTGKIATAYVKGVQSKNVELMEIFRGIMPFLGIVIFAMFLMYLFPGIALWLPDTLFAN
jgi:beta-glucosidase